MSTVSQRSTETMNMPSQETKDLYLNDMLTSLKIRKVISTPTSHYDVNDVNKRKNKLKKQLNDMIKRDPEFGDVGFVIHMLVTHNRIGEYEEWEKSNNMDKY
jgi:hypothetical protein